MAKIKSKTVVKSKKAKINGFKNKIKIQKKEKSQNYNSDFIEKQLPAETNGFKNKVKKSKIKKREKAQSNSDFLIDNLEESGNESEQPSELSENDENENNFSEQDDENEDSDIDMDEELNKSGSEEENDAENSEDEAEKHMESLAKLQEIDPEFYKFLQENDKKLLQFNLLDDEGDDGEEDEEVEELHKPEGELEVASDESDFEDDDSPKDDKVITLKLLKQWQTNIQTDKSNKTITALIHAFHAAMKRVSSASEEDDNEPTKYKVEGSSVFNAVIQLCVLELGPAIRRFLGLAQGSKQPPHKCKKFVKVKNILKSYFTDLLRLLQGVTSSNIQTVLLKHLHYMSPILISYPNITKSLVKRLISLWGTADDSVRVIAFFCILRITNNQQAAILDTVLKSMYITFVKNSKFVSLNSLASINFMRRSLVEMFALDVNVTYQHVFLYIRQLAIHLRNAITVNKKENNQSVYNWQFINSLRLWGNLLSVNYHKPLLQQLVYPFVQVCLGTIKLVPTAQYYPLRFHVVQVLMDLSKNTGVFVPVLPFILEPLSSYDFNKKHQKVSMKPIHFTCLLRLSKSQLQENGFKDMVIETVYGLLLEYLSDQSHSIAFPDLSLLCIVQIKKFLKKCRNANYNRKLKQVLEKIEQNNQFIEAERIKLTLNITDFKQIEGWESQIKTKGTPLSTYYDSWYKLNKIKKNKQMTKNEELGDYKLPTIKKVKKADKKKDEGPVELFPSDSEDEAEASSDDKPRRGKRGGKKNRKAFADETGPVEDGGEKDLVDDIDINDW